MKFSPACLACRINNIQAHINIINNLLDKNENYATLTKIIKGNLLLFDPGLSEDYIWRDVLDLARINFLLKEIGGEKSGIAPG
jgi:hypothetical protein